MFKIGRSLLLSPPLLVVFWFFVLQLLNGSLMKDVSFEPLFFFIIIFQVVVVLVEVFLRKIHLALVNADQVINLFLGHILVIDYVVKIALVS